MEVSTTAQKWRFKLQHRNGGLKGLASEEMEVSTTRQKWSWLETIQEQILYDSFKINSTIRGLNWQELSWFI